MIATKRPLEDGSGAWHDVSLREYLVKGQQELTPGEAYYRIPQKRFRFNDVAAHQLRTIGAISARAHAEVARAYDTFAALRDHAQAASSENAKRNRRPLNKKKRAAINTGTTTLLTAVADDSEPDDVLAEILGPAYKHEECDSMASEPESETVGDSFRADTMNSALVGSEYPLPQSHAHAQLDSGATLTITPDGDLVRNTTPVYTTIKMADDHSLTGWFEKGIFSGLTHGIPWPDHPALVVPTFPHTLLSQPAAVTAGNAFISVSIEGLSPN